MSPSVVQQQSTMIVAFLLLASVSTTLGFLVPFSDNLQRREIARLPFVVPTTISVRPPPASIASSTVAAESSEASSLETDAPEEATDGDATTSDAVADSEEVTSDAEEEEDDDDVAPLVAEDEAPKKKIRRERHTLFVGNLPFGRCSCCSTLGLDMLHLFVLFVDTRTLMWFLNHCNSLLVLLRPL